MPIKYESIICILVKRAKEEKEKVHMLLTKLKLFASNVHIHFTTSALLLEKSAPSFPNHEIYI